MKKVANTTGKYLVAVKTGGKKNQIFSFKKKYNRDSFIAEIKSKGYDYATTTLK